MLNTESQARPSIEATPIRTIGILTRRRFNSVKEMIDYLKTSEISEEVIEEKFDFDWRQEGF
jgi:hypothetical protein